MGSGELRLYPTAGWTLPLLQVTLAPFGGFGLGALYITCNSSATWNAGQAAPTGGQAHLPSPRGRQALAGADDRVAEIEQHRSWIVGPERFAATCRTPQELLDTLTSSNNGT